MAWSQYSKDIALGYMFPNTTSYIGQFKRTSDFNRFRNDFHKNTGRSIRYQSMRGYDPQLLAYDLGRGGKAYTDSIYKPLMNGAANLTGWNTRTTRSLLFGLD